VDQESLVLLENKDNLLPLKKGEISKIALIGPMGNYVNYGDYVVYGAAYEAKAVNPLQGLQNALENSTTIVEFAQGCQRWSNDKSGFHEAIDLAKDSDVAIVMVGTWTRDQNELWGVCPGGCNATTGEHNDQSDLRLVGAMADLVKAITDTDTPTIVILSSGVPITEAWLTDAADALIQQFYPGEQGGNALADILFGDVNPSGRLAISMSHSVGTLPVYYNYLKGTKYAGTSGQVFENGTLDFGHDYVLDTPFAWYPFGYGISYSNFTWSNVTIDKTNYTATDTIKVSLNVTNTSPNDGQEVVQIYIQDVISSIATPIQELKGFSKVAVSAGQTVTVNIDISIADLALWGINQTWEVESGRFNLYAGKDSANILSQASFWVN
jgi:beta-glucosidase